MNKEELLKAIMELPKTETDDLISAMNSINVNDLMSAVDRFDKVPTYDELLKENKKQKEVIDKATDIINDYLKEDYSIYTENEIEVDLIVKLKNMLKEVSE